MRFLVGLHILFFLFSGYCVQAQADFTASARKGCVPFDIRFAIDTTSYDISSITTAEWDFGNGQTETATATDTVVGRYEEEGLYTVALTINGDDANTTRRSGFINALEALNSDFEIIFEKDLPEYTYTFVPEHFPTPGDTSVRYDYIWEHFEGSTSLRRIVYFVDQSNPDEAIEQYQYADTGLYTISLQIRQINSDYICESETRKDLLISEEFIVGNVFTPKSTDYFIVDPENPATVLKFQIFSRTGIQVFEQEAPIIYWDGRTNSGQELGTGVYFYVVESTTDDPEGRFSKKGFIHLFR